MDKDDNEDPTGIFDGVTAVVEVDEVDDDGDSVVETDAANVVVVVEGDDAISGLIVVTDVVGNEVSLDENGDEDPIVVVSADN